MFLRLGIAPNLLVAAGVRRVTDLDARELYGIRFHGDLTGIVFPYFHPFNGHRSTARLRRDNPETNSEGRPENRYICPWGNARHLYFAPGVCELLSDVTVPVVFVDAEKSVLAITALAARHGRRILAIGTGGCWGWRGKTGIEPGPNGERGETRGPLPDFGPFVLEGRKVLLLSGANVASNQRVRDARRALVEALAGWGAIVADPGK